MCLQSIGVHPTPKAPSTHRPSAPRRHRSSSSTSCSLPLSSLPDLDDTTLLSDPIIHDSNVIYSPDTPPLVASPVEEDVFGITTFVDKSRYLQFSVTTFGQAESGETEEILTHFPKVQDILVPVHFQSSGPSGADDDEAEEEDTEEEVGHETLTPALLHPTTNARAEFNSQHSMIGQDQTVRLNDWTEPSYSTITHEDVTVPLNDASERTLRQGGNHHDSTPTINRSSQPGSRFTSSHGGSKVQGRVTTPYRLPGKSVPSSDSEETGDYSSLPTQKGVDRSDTESDEMSTIIGAQLDQEQLDLNAGHLTAHHLHVDGNEADPNDEGSDLEIGRLFSPRPAEQDVSAGGLQSDVDVDGQDDYRPHDLVEGNADVFYDVEPDISPPSIASRRKRTESTTSVSEEHHPTQHLTLSHATVPSSSLAWDSSSGDSRRQKMRRSGGKFAENFSFDDGNDQLCESEEPVFSGLSSRISMTAAFVQGE